MDHSALVWEAFLNEDKVKELITLAALNEISNMEVVQMLKMIAEVKHLVINIVISECLNRLDIEEKRVLLMS